MKFFGTVDPGAEVKFTDMQLRSLNMRLDCLVDAVYLRGNGIDKEFFKGYVRGLCETGILSDEEHDEWIKRLNKAGGLKE